MREQDVSILTSQLRVARQQVQSLSESLKVEQARGAELADLALQQKGRLEEVEGAKQTAIDGLAAEVKELSFQIQVRNDKIRALESQLQEGSDETERMRDRVKTDLRKIRLRERELENKLEILKKDSEALIGARESKIVELKRKLDLLEFNLDLVQDQVSREREKTKHYRQQLERAAQVVRVAGGLLDSPTHPPISDKKAS
jgi:chromosome segregation ATPase